MSTILGTDVGRDNRVVGLADLATGVQVFSAATPVTELDRVFRADRQLRSLVVHDDGVHFLLSREQVKFTLTGRLGYGCGLHARSTARQMVPENSFFLLVSVSQIFERLSTDFQYAALHDSSTGLPNRRQLQERGSA